MKVSPLGFRREPPMYDGVENSDLGMVIELLELIPGAWICGRRGPAAMDLGPGYLDGDGVSGVVCAVRDYELVMARLTEDSGGGE